MVRDLGVSPNRKRNGSNNVLEALMRRFKVRGRENQVEMKPRLKILCLDSCRKRTVLGNRRGTMDVSFQVRNRTVNSGCGRPGD